MDHTVAVMNTEVATGMDGYSNSKVFKKTVLKHLGMLCANRTNASPTFRDHAFPDILVNGFGIEVKHSKRGSWHGTGNSIFESTKDQSVDKIALVFCRYDLPEIRWRWYEDSIKGVRVSHSPRYMIDMDNENHFFSEIGLSLDQFRQTDLRSQMKIVKDHVQKRINPGERLWWLDEDQEHTLPASVRLYRLLDRETKAAIRAEASLMCPQIFKSSRQKGKYDDAAMYILTQHGVLAPHTRDLFTAGSVAGTERGGDYLIKGIQSNTVQIVAAAQRLDDALFVEYWGESCAPEYRLRRWLELADHYRPDNPPSDYISFAESVEGQK